MDKTLFQMWFYREAFRLFSILVFILTWNIFVESLKVKYVSSIDIQDVDDIQEDNKQNITDFPKTIIFVDQNGKINYRGLSDIINQDVDSVKLVKGQGIEKVLRGKYEDACIKVAIRKCYKALLNVRNKICKIAYRCKRDFKEDFKEESKRAAIAEFDYSKYLPKSISPTKFRGAAEFVDETRKNYIQLCVPLMIKELKLKQKKQKYIYETHIFRKSGTNTERECRMISRNKCIISCAVVRKKLCSVHDCGVRRRQYFKKACKDVCRMEYREKSESESSDDEYLML